MEDYDTPDDFAEEINTAARKRKALEADKTKKPKWKSGEIDTLIDELEEQSCLWDVFDKDYHNREKREVAYTELEDILKHTKKDIKTKIAGLRTQLGREIAKTNSWKSGQATSEKYKSTRVFYDKLQFLRPVTQAAKSKDNLSTKSCSIIHRTNLIRNHCHLLLLLNFWKPLQGLAKRQENPWRPGKRTFYRLVSKYFERQLALNLCQLRNSVHFPSTSQKS